MSQNAHSHHSTLRERIVEHVFVGEALRSLWRRGIVDVEVLRSEFDAFGYDLVMVRGPVIRHIQLKTGTSKKPGTVSLALALGERPSGCAIWIRVAKNDLSMGPYFFFGSGPGQPLPPIADYPIPKRSTHTKERLRPDRTNHRNVPGDQFRCVNTLDEVLDELLGPLPSVP
jgi:hypothetical protein